MANFCTHCGHSVQREWNVCPFCGYTLYHRATAQKLGVETYQPINQLSSPKREGVDEKHLSKSHKAAIILGASILIAAIIIPVVGLSIYNFNILQREVPFYVNNGWTFTSYTVSTSRANLDFYQSQPHPSHTHWDANYTVSIIESYCTPNDEKIIEIAQAIRSKCFDQNDSEEVINALLSFTQAIGYKSEFIDLAQYPLETVYNQGDCEDLSVLFGSLVVALGYDAIIIIINSYDEILEEWIGHACVGVYLNYTPTQHGSYPPSNYFSVSENSNEYWICETTVQGWMIGELPASDPIYYLMEAYEFIN